jgi:hypothetical protein
VSIPSILLPVFVQVALIFALGFWMIFARDSRLNGGVDAGRADLAGDSFKNQFEIPVLFFALIPLAILTHKADYLFIVMEWIFVLSRLAHAAIHTTTNRQPARGAFWFVGVLTLLLMWLIFAIRILFPQTLSPL